MTTPTYDRAKTALLFIDPYNDFLSEGGKLWPRVKDVAESVHLLDNLRAISGAVRASGIQVFIVPHRRWEPGDYDRWHHPSPSQQAIMKRHTFARGEWHPDFAPQAGDIVVGEHWGSSGFANTDLDLQLKQQASATPSSWACLPIPAPRPRRNMPRSSATTSRWCATRRRHSATR